MKNKFIPLLSLIFIFLFSFSSCSAKSLKYEKLEGEWLTENFIIGFNSETEGYHSTKNANNEWESLSFTYSVKGNKLILSYDLYQDTIYKAKMSKDGTMLTLSNKNITYTLHRADTIAIKKEENTNKNYIKDQVIMTILDTNDVCILYNYEAETVMTAIDTQKEWVPAYDNTNFVKFEYNGKTYYYGCGIITSTENLSFELSEYYRSEFDKIMNSYVESLGIFDPVI